MMAVMAALSISGITEHPCEDTSAMTSSCCIRHVVICWLVMCGLMLCCLVLCCLGLQQLEQMKEAAHLSKS